MDSNIELEGRIYVAGTRGYSNYEIAVKNGFVGTEEEWLEKITQDEADIVWENFKNDVSSGKISFSMEDSYDSNTESLILSVSPVSEESE